MAAPASAAFASMIPRIWLDGDGGQATNVPATVV
jgi:hypothetical protein